MSKGVIFLSFFIFFFRGIVFADESSNYSSYSVNISNNNSDEIQEMLIKADALENTEEIARLRKNLDHFFLQDNQNYNVKL